MSFTTFLSLVEIKTKVASILPFLAGTLYTVYHFNSFSFINFLLMLVSLLAIDMCTTAINNYYDYKKANKRQGYNYEVHNAIVNNNLSEKLVKGTILTLLVIAVGFGLLLFLNTDIVVLLLGALSFGVGIFYTFGPVPISRTPLGEIFSGLFMGFVIPFISIYIHQFDQGLVSLLYRAGQFILQLNAREVIYIFLFSLPLVIGISNIMLANNICDIKDDLENNRYTLPIYIGKEKALKIFEFLYYFIYLDLTLLLVLGIVPLFNSITLLTFIPVKKNINLFLRRQSKKETFEVAVKNFILINTVQLLALGIGLVI